MKINYIEEMRHKKEEINTCIERYHSTITFMITTVIAILSFGVSAHSGIITFFALIASAFLWSKVVRYKNSIAQHSAYCQVFLENVESGFMWETVNHLATENENKNHQKTINRYLEWEVLGINIISLVVTVLLTIFSDVSFTDWSLVNFINASKNVSWIQAIFLGIVIITFCVSSIKVIRCKNVHQMRCDLIEIFKREVYVLDEMEEIKRALVSKIKNDYKKEEK